MHRIHHLRQKIQHAQSILTNTLQTVATIRAHEQMTKNHLALPFNVRAGFEAEIKNISTTHEISAQQRRNY